MDVGFIGLGAMGMGMVKSLLRAGHNVHVWSRRDDPAQELAKLGATIVASATDTFCGDVFISMLSNDDALRSVLMESDVIPVTGSDTVHINMATVSVGYAKELADQHDERGVKYLSAPVFGRENVAEAGELNIMVSGDQKLIERMQPVFDALGKKTFNVGSQPNAANAVKIAGNMMVANAIESLSEGIALALSYGVEPSEFTNLITSTIFNAPVYKVYGDIIANERYEPAGFTMSLGLKDVRLALAAGDQNNVPLPLSSVVRDAMLEAMANGGENKDWASLGEVARRRAGLV